MTFPAMPPVPLEGLNPNLQQLLFAIKETCETITGQRGNGDFRALLSGQVTLNPLDSTSITTTNASTTEELRRDLQLVLDRLALHEAFMNTLIDALKGEQNDG